jgi:hypothetical protein
MEVDDAGPSHVEDEPTFKPAPTTSGRVRTFPRQYNDFLPSSATSVPHMPDRPPKIINKNISDIVTDPSPSPELPQVADILLETEPNEFGLYCVYTTFPTNDPDETLDLNDVCDAPGLATSQSPDASRNFNLCTYKLHALRNYVKNIWLYGTTDNYSTQVVSLFLRQAIHQLTH